MNELKPLLPSNAKSATVPAIIGIALGPDARSLIQFEAQKKSAGVAFALCWLLGIWGDHRFYLGRPLAVTMLIVTLISLPLCFVVVGCFGLIAVWIWMIVDLFSVSKWVREYNTAILARIATGQSRPIPDE